MRSLWFYLPFEAISLLFIFLAQRKRKASLNKKEVLDKKKKNVILQKKTLIGLICMLLSALPLLFLIAFRARTVGADTERYTLQYLAIANNSFSNTGWLGTGFIILCKIISFFAGLNYSVFYLVVGLITLFFLYKAIFHESDNLALSLFIFFSLCFFYQTFNQFRQMMAIAIVLYSLRFLFEKDFKRYLIFILLAGLIHKSALIMIPIYFISKIKVNKKTIMIFAILTVFVLLSSSWIVEFLAQTSYGASYSDSQYFKSRGISSVIKLVFGVFAFLVAFIFGRTIKKQSVSEKNNRLLILLMTYILIQTIAIRIYILERIAMYFLASLIILLPNVYANLDKKKYKVLFLVGVCAVFLAFHYVYYMSCATNALFDNYKFIFE